MNTTLVRKQIAAAKVLIQTYGWTKGAYIRYVEDTPCGLCLVGALLCVEAGRILATNEVINIEVTSTGDWLNELSLKTSGLTVVTFNDSCESVEQLFEFLDAAVAELQ